MAYSYNEVVGTGAAQLIPVPDYIDQAHIKVSVNTVDTTSFTWVNANTIRITAPAGQKVRVRRSSSPGARVVDYIDGQSLTEEVLDNDSKQAFFLAQEQLDSTNEALAAFGSLDAALAFMQTVQTDATNAKDSAAASASTANTKAGAASTSAAAALASEGKAKTSETNSKTSETNAKTSETNAKASENQAGTSAANALTYAGAAQGSASAAAGSAAAAATSEANAAASAASYNSVPQNTFSANRTLALADAGKHLYHPTSDVTARTVSIPANAVVAFPPSTVITIVNGRNAGVLTLAIGGTDTLTFAGSGSTGNRTLAAGGIATLLKVTATEWMVSGPGLT
jgi:hypothetical protein